MGSVEKMKEMLKGARPLRLFHAGDVIRGKNTMKAYSYTLTEAPGKNFAEGFEPYVTPGEMLSLGVFGGKYLNDCIGEFPKEWFVDAMDKGKLSPEGTNIHLNLFQIDSRLSRSEWKKAGWLPSARRTVRIKKRSILSDPVKNPDERGWFQWYCRYWLGRRLPDLDAVQIQRWKNFKRHYSTVKKACTTLTCRPRQRQALLQWAWKYD